MTLFGVLLLLFCASVDAQALNAAQYTALMNLYTAIRTLGGSLFFFFVCVAFFLCVC